MNGLNTARGDFIPGGDGILSPVGASVPGEKSPEGGKSGGAEMFRHTGLVQVGWLCISYTRNVPIAPLFQVRPGTYRKKEETEGGEMKMYDDYSIIGKNEVEWFSSRRGCTHPYGLLVRMLDAHNLDELNRLFQLDKDSHFRQKFEYELKIQ